MTEQNTGNTDTLQEPPFLTVGAVSSILEKASTGKISYEDLIGVNPYSLTDPWLPDYNHDDGIIRPKGYAAPPPMAEADIEQAKKADAEHLQAAQQGFGEFLKVMVAAYDRNGSSVAKLPDGSNAGDADLTTVGEARSVVYELFHNKFEAKWKAKNEDLPLVPWLAYQNGKPHVAGTQLPGRVRQPDFLHFGTASKEQNHDGFTESVRVYMNPKVEQTAHAVALVCERFFEQHGYIPRGKFVEDATATDYQDRLDRAIFWTHSPEELTELLGIVQDVTSKHPELFDGREPLPLGMPVVVDGRELPTIRLTQEVKPGGHHQSFNSSRDALLSEAVARTFSAGVPEHLTDEDISAYTKTLQELAPQAGFNKQDFSFNDNQDMSIVYDVLSRVSKA